MLDNITFDNISTEDITKICNLRKEGARHVAYFGTVGYKYGPITHSPQAYPQSEVFDQIFNVLNEHDPTFTRDNFTCMVNVYDDGAAHINQHSDNEWSLVQDSNIYTISIGASRTIKYVNTIGPLDIRTCELMNGSVTSMSAKSQAHWTHGIDPQPDVTRHLTNAPAPARPKPNPVRKPAAHPAEEILKPPCAPPGQCSKDSKRLLFLTDSILNGFQPHMFKELTDHTCIKKTNYDLVNIVNFQDEFKYSDIVLISGGVNDLARNGHSAESLADFVLSRLEQFSKKFPDTKFVINSIILTKLKHINEHILRFNRYMRNFCLRHENIIFFDSHDFMVNNRHKVDGLVYDKHDRSGIHITYLARRHIGLALVQYIKRTCTSIHARYCASPVQRRSWSVR